MKETNETSKERIEHILESISNIHAFMGDHTEESLIQERMILSACLYEFTIIGEAVSKIDPTVLSRYDYPWHKVKSFRNLIVHEYRGIDMHALWSTSSTSLLTLKHIMEEMLSREYGTGK